MQIGWQILIVLLALLVQSMSCEAEPQKSAPAEISKDVLVLRLAAETQTTGILDLSLSDKRRHKEVPLKVTYPLSGHRCPVIVFSHGAGGSREHYEFLAAYWAGHGYVCLQPSHADSIALNRQQGKRLSFAKTMRNLPVDKASWIERAQDVTFVIDELPALNAAGALKDKLDLARVAVGGHSLGAFTAQLLGGVDMPSVAGETSSASVPPANIRCIVAISPQGIRPGAYALGFESASSFKGLHVPALFLTGDRDESMWNTSAQRKDGFDNSPPGGKFFVSINGANHMTFAGVQADDEPARFGRSLWQAAASSNVPAYGDEGEHQAIAQQVTTLFWDAYLKGDPQIKKYLEKHGFAQIVESSAFTDRK